MQGRPPYVREKISQLPEEDFYPGLLFFQMIGERQVGSERRPLLFVEHKAFAAEVKEESAQGLLGRRMNSDGDLNPAGVLGPG